ncbi:NADH-quinone oxidoreductase subunit C [Streptomyces sp. MS06]|uniref:NADH-quinone oxidoreductase subunit C n=1 Tax=Streptomyces sp. MS06 TaxID=3385974 RepID=UPI00399FE4F4
MTAVGWLPAPADELFGADATAEESYGVLTVDVPAASWLAALETARDRLGCTYFDWLSAVDEPGTGFRVAAHVAALAPPSVRRLLLRTTVPHERPALPSAVGVYAGAGWHERETHEMFGVAFEGHPALDHLLLPENFEGHPLRKDFVLAARVAKAWPGAKEPGESEHGGPKRRQMLPPGVPDPNEWGPLKGQLPPAPARPARGAGRAAGAGAAGRAAGERPARRTRTAAEGSASQAAADTGAAGSAAPRRSRSASEGSASRPASGTPGAAAPRRARSASGGSASQRAETPKAPETPKRPETPEAPETPETPEARRTPDAAEAAEQAQPDRTPGTPGTPGTPAAPGRGSDAPWHHARPAFDESERPEGRPQGPEQRREGPEPGPQEATHGEEGAADPERDESRTSGPAAPEPTTDDAGPDRPAGGTQ